ncbi:MAG TPA: DUF4192 domain-containing protein [Micromonosporaceae bacterium]
MDSLASVSLRTPADMIAAIPYLFGFHPADSLVILGLRAKRVVFQLRVDLPPAAEARAGARQIATIVARQHVTRALLAGFGSALAVTPMVRAVRAELMRRRIDVPEALRATDGRYFSYTCHDPACCDPDGTPYDSSTSVVAAAATAAGINVLASREAVAARLAPAAGPERDAAALRADARLCDLIARTKGRPDRETVVAAGIEAVDRAILRWRSDRALDDDEVAWLGLLLVNIAVRDHAWERVGEDLALHAELWTELVRRVVPDLVAPPATLLAFAAWRSGGGAIASIALERAVEADPTYRMAQYLGAAFDGGLSPTLFDRDPVGAGVDVHGGSAQEADDRHSGLGGQFDRE